MEEQSLYSLYGRWRCKLGKNIFYVYLFSLFAKNTRTLLVKWFITYQNNAASPSQLLVCHTPRTWWGLNRTLTKIDVHSAAYPWLLCPFPSPLKTMPETYEWTKSPHRQKRKKETDNCNQDINRSIIKKFLFVNYPTSKYINEPGRKPQLFPSRQKS